jgi:streptogramin lyase
VFVPNTSLNDVAIYAPPYTGAPIATIAVNDPRDVAIDGSGNLFVSSGTEVQEFAPPYTGAATATITNAINSPVTIALDGSGDLFVQNDGNDTVSVYAPPYTGSPSVISAPGCVPQCFEQVGGGMAAIPGTRDVVFTNDAYATAAYGSPYAGGSPAFTIPTSGSYYGAWGIAIDPAGDVFIAYTASSTVAEYQPPYTAAAVTLTSANGVDEPRGLSLDRSGDLFVSNFNGTVTEYAPPYTGTPVTIDTVSTGGTYPYSTALSP